jgi:PPOX class probable F420-dependent enzyme
MSAVPHDRPQPPPLVDAELEPFLRSAPIARLATHNADGTTHIAPVWFKYAEGQIWIPTQDMTQKVRNIKRSADVSVLVDTQEPPYIGVLIYGEALLDYDDVFNKKIDVYRKYFTEENLPDPYKLAEKFVPVVVRVVPKRLVTFNDQRTRF